MFLRGFEAGGPQLQDFLRLNFNWKIRTGKNIILPIYDCICRKKVSAAIF